jgi:hypothetical protein
MSWVSGISLEARPGVWRRGRSYFQVFSVNWGCVQPDFYFLASRGDKSYGACTCIEPIGEPQIGIRKANGNLI